MQEMWVQSLGREDSPEKGVTTHSSIFFFPTPEFLPWKSHGQRSLEGYSPWHHKDLRQLRCDHSENSNQYPEHNELSPLCVWEHKLFPVLGKFQGTVQPTAFQAVLPPATRTCRPRIYKSVFSKGSRGPTPDPNASSLYTLSSSLVRCLVNPSHPGLPSSVGQLSVSVCP